MTVGIRASVFLLALVPAALVAVLLVAYLTNTRIKDLEQSLMDRGQTIADQLARSCEYGLLTDNREELDRLARSILRQSDVSRVAILDAGGKTLVSSDHASPSADAKPAAPRIDGKSPLLFESPVYYLATARHGATNPREEALEQPELIGSVRLELTRETLIERQRQVIRTSLLLTLCCLLLASLLGYRIGRRVSDPIMRMKQVVRDLRDGRLDTSIREFSTAELGDLERDINAMASALKASHERLQEQMNEATGELRQAMNELEHKNAELDAARNKALEMSRIKSELLTNMSHEIRTPMNGVMGFITLLSKTDLKPTQRAYLQTLHASAENLMVVLNDILDLSKIEAGKFKIRRRSFDLRATLEDAVLLFAPNAHEKGLSLILDIAPEVASELIGDAPRIAQIVTNFVSNAVKFTDQGEVQVKVDKAWESDHVVTLELQISDTGIGIDPRDQARLFAAFDQLDTELARPRSGTGLGLAISRRLVSLMQGEIQVQSQLNQGTVFRIRIVVDKPPTPQFPRQRPGQAKAAHTTLLVSRSPAVRQAAAHILEYAGIDHHELETATEAIERAFQPTVDAQGELITIVMDQGCIAELAHLSPRPIKKSPLLILLGGTEQQQHIAETSGLFSAVHCARLPPVSRELLPLINGYLEPGSTKAPSPPQAPGLAPLPSARSLKILLADDNRINRQLARIFLDQLGVTVAEAQNGAQALELTRGGVFDLILMDIHMPEMDGLTATRKIRADMNNPNHNTPVIALTADAMTRERELYLRSGMNDHLGKPVTEGILRQLLGKWCA